MSVVWLIEATSNVNCLAYQGHRVKHIMLSITERLMRSASEERLNDIRGRFRSYSYSSLSVVCSVFVTAAPTGLRVLVWISIEVRIRETMKIDILVFLLNKLGRRFLFRNTIAIPIQLDERRWIRRWAQSWWSEAHRQSAQNGHDFQIPAQYGSKSITRCLLIHCRVSLLVIMRIARWWRTIFV